MKELFIKEMTKLKSILEDNGCRNTIRTLLADAYTDAAYYYYTDKFIPTETKLLVNNLVDRVMYGKKDDYEKLKRLKFIELYFITNGVSKIRHWNDLYKEVSNEL